MARPWQEALTELVSTSLTQQQLTLLLEIVAGVTRNVTRNAERHAAQRSSGALRSARWRENRKIKALAAKANDVAASVTEERHAQRHTVTQHCDLSSLLTESVVEQRGNQEKKEQQPELLEGRKKVSRGTRLQAGALITDEDLDFALNAGMTRDRALQAWAEFVDYWISIPGQRGTKLDWSATWRNRVRTITAKGVKNGQGTSRQSLSDLAFDLADEARRLERNAGIVR